MKKSLVIYGMILSALLSCNTDTFEPYESHIAKQNENRNAVHKITEQDALDIAGKLFKQTRSTSDYTVEYVLNDDATRTRAANTTDTLAYIINFGSDNGFAVISSDNRVFPLLAYSDTGHFKYEKSYDNPVYANFISLLGDYMATINENDTAINIPNDYLSSCIIEKPNLHTYKWNQGPPFDKYVIQEHPGCPVGCVAVATGQIMVNCKDILDYHDSQYVFYAIREAMDDGHGLLLDNDKTNITIVNPGHIEYSYETAVDHVAKLLYWIGKDLYMSYNPGGSSASSYSAMRLLKELGYNIMEKNFTSFSDTAMVQRIKEGHLLYVDGREVNNNINGHAWIIDGYSFCWKDISEKKEITNVSLHCDWGWGGYCNGYYCGDIFRTTPDYALEKMKYFSVRHKPYTISTKN